MFAFGKTLSVLVLVAIGPAPSDAAKTADAPKPARVRPVWTDAKEGLVDEGYQKVILIGPYSSEPECDREIPVKLEEAVAEYASSYNPELGPRLHVTSELLHSEQPRLVREEHRETIQSSVGPMRQIHLRVVFDRKFNRWLDQRLAAIVVGRRINLLATAGAVVLAALMIAYLWARKEPAVA